MRLSPDTTRQILTPYHDRFRQIIETGWQDWLDLPAGYRVNQDIRSKRSSVWCSMVAAAERVFYDEDSVVIVREQQSAFIIIEDAVVVRLKKMNGGGGSSNLVTQTQLDWREPSEQLEIPGIPSELPRVEIGYVPNSLDNGFDQILVAHPNGQGVEWSYALIASAPDVEEPDTPTIVPELPATKVRPKHVDEATGETHTGTEDA